PEIRRSGNRSRGCRVSCPNHRRRRVMRAGRRGAAAAVSLVLLCGAVGCAGSSSSAGSGGGGGAEGGGATADKLAALGPFNSRTALADASVETRHGPNAESLPPLRSTVIKTAQLSLEVKKSGFADALDQANQIATDAGGYVISTDQSGGSLRSALIVIRVPAARFTEALGKMHHLGGGKLRSES